MTDFNYDEGMKVYPTFGGSDGVSAPKLSSSHLTAGANKLKWFSEINTLAYMRGVSVRGHLHWHKFTKKLPVAETVAVLTVLALLTLGEERRHKRIHRLFIGAACQPCFGSVVMSPATA